VIFEPPGKRQEMDPEILRQYDAVREDVGLIDRSDVGKLAITGPDRFTWLQGMVSNDVSLLERADGRLPACILDATGHVLSDVALINILRYDPDPFAAMTAQPKEDFILLELPRENVAKIIAILDRYLIMEDVEIRDISEAIGTISLQGPRALDSWLPGEGLPFDVLDRVYLIQADHTGSGGCDLYFRSARKDEARAAILTANVPEIGPDAQEILRVEAGIPKYGADMDESVLAPEAGLMQTHISLTKGCYVGQEIVARIESRGHTNRALTGLIVAEGDLPGPGDKIFPLPTEDEPLPRESGRITSVVKYAPAVGERAIALGYVRHEHRTPGNRLVVQGDRRKSFVTVAELPFYRRPRA
jgi:aminomethyltransferase